MLASLALALSLRPAAAEPAAPFISISGWLRQLTAEQLGLDAKLAQSIGTAYLSADGAAAPGVSYRVSGRAFFDAAYALRGQYPRGADGGQESQAELRDTYVDLSAGPWDARLGKQQVVWGEALGTFVADVVNARDYRWFILPDFSELRIPQWGADVEYTAGDTHLEGVWMPVPEFDRLGANGSEFAPPYPLQPGALPVEAPTSQPAASLDNGEWGGRVSRGIGGFDVSLFGYHTWDKAPVLPRALSNVGGIEVETFFPSYRRLEVGGLTFSKDFSGWVAHGELVYNHGKYFSVIDPSSPDGLVKRDDADYLAAVDHSWGDWETDVQLSQRAIFGYVDGMFQQQRLRTTASVELSGSLVNGYVRPSVLFAEDLGVGDGMVRPRIAWRVTPRCLLASGLDVFFGSADGIFGYYSGATRAYGEAAFYF